MTIFTDEALCVCVLTTKYINNLAAIWLADNYSCGMYIQLVYPDVHRTSLVFMIGQAMPNYIKTCVAVIVWLCMQSAKWSKDDSYVQEKWFK